MDSPTLLSELAFSTPETFFAYCQENANTTGVVPHPSIGGAYAPPARLNALEARVRSNSGYAGHEAVFFQANALSGCLFFVFVHNTVRGMAQGGTRLMAYDTLDDLLYDGLRLSRAMTEKNAVAELWWGGGKAIICPVDGLANIDAERRKCIFEQYGAFVASLNGVYVAAEDMNTTPEDMLTILSADRFVTCLPPRAGGSSNPSPWTAKGVFKAMLATVRHVEGRDSLAGMSVLVQGVGNVGHTLARLAAGAGASILAADPNPRAIEALQNALPEVTVVSGDQLFDTPCDIFAPSARGGVIDRVAVEKLRCRYVIGAANNQLVDDAEQSRQLQARNIVYLPDFFINRMGIINCANEQYGYLEADLNTAVEKIYADVQWLLKTAGAKHQTPYQVAIEQAKKLAAIPHPIWGHRGVRIIQDLLQRKF
ncbi:MAG: amino acid dehydrogenase [Saprospirales bacterium]|jgi:leucine dehydrogenase|nr:amino acid dehydrogenase [Saprospirales bacterium]MBK8921877.1 amino acid dehydrogenase [Saprospirales bacterium]